MSKYILGLDGGATKSHLAIFDESGNCVSTALYGPLNHEVMKGSYAELEERLGEFIWGAINEVNVQCEDLAHAVFGLAGVDTDSQHARISDIIQMICLKEFTVCNDSFLGVAAGCPDCVGICAINGTGFKLAAIDNSGAAVQTCGVGGYTDDKGGGTWFGLKAISSVYNELYKLGQPTVMREILFKMAGITRKEDYLEVIYEKFHGRTLNSVKLNSVIFDAAARGDAVAMSVLDESAEEYAGGIARLAMDLDFPADKTLYVTLAGSVFVRQKVRILQKLIEKRVYDALDGRDVEYIYLDAPPVAGALMWAAQKAGFNIEMKSIKAGLIGLHLRG